MKTLVVDRDGNLEIREVEKPAITPKQALVKMISCGVCNGTDAKLIHHKFKGFGEEMYPLMLGHEGVGEVVAIGSEVTTFHLGDKILLPFVDADPEKYGELQSGWGAFSEYGVVHDLAAYPAGTAPDCAYAQTVLPEGIDPVDASMIITLREVLSSIKRFGMKENQSVAIFGCGPVGLTFIRFMSLLGIHPIIAFDIIPEKLEEAKACGATYVYNSRTENVKEAVRTVCPEGVQYVVDAVGISSLINQGMELIWSKAPYNWKLHFQQFPSKKEEGEATNQILAWIQSGAIDLKDYISDYFRFDEVLEAFGKLEEKKIAKKGIIVF